MMPMISKGKPSAIQMRGMEQRLAKFQTYVGKAFENKLKQNCEVCGFLMISPRGQSTKTTVMFNGNVVGKIGDGKFELYEYNPLVYGDANKFKYEIIAEIAASLNGVEEAPIENKDDVPVSDGEKIEQEITSAELEKKSPPKKKPSRSKKK